MPHIASAEERLACFDREVATMDAAQSSGELVAMDRQQVRRTRRSLFGMRCPISAYSATTMMTRRPRRLERTVRSATQNANGKWIITIEDGARWLEIEPRPQFPAARGPADPHPPRLARLLFLNVNNQTAIRMRRIN